MADRALTEAELAELDQAMRWGAVSLDDNFAAARIALWKRLLAEHAALREVARTARKHRMAALLQNYTLPGGREKYAEAEAEADSALAALEAAFPSVLEREG